MTGELKRKLDLAANASIDLVALNNQVVKMRPAVKRSKLYIINKLTKKIKKFRNKKGTEAQKKQNNSKADNLVKEIKVIQVLKPDYISKYALGTTEKFEKIICQQNLDMERRALARLAEHDFIQEIVKKFREEHEDWKELTAYLMTKHTSREFKKKKNAQKLAKVATNVKATEKIVESYLDDKLKDSNEESITKDEISKVKSKQVRDEEANEGSNCTAEETTKPLKEISKTIPAKANKQKNKETDRVSNDDLDSESNSGSEENYHFISKRKGAVSHKLSRCSEKQSIDDVDDDDDDNDDDDDDVKRNDEELNEELDDRISCTDSVSSDMEDLEPDEFKPWQKLSKSTLEDKTEEESDSESENKVENTKNLTLKQKNQERLKQKELEQKDMTNKVNSVKEKTSGEMIVKKINLEEWTEDSIEKEPSNTVPGFLLKTNPQKTKRKVKDPFFCTSDDEESKSDVKSDNNDDSDDDVIQKSKVKDGSDSEGNEDSNSDAEQVFGVRGFSTTFLGSLNSGRMMKSDDDPQVRSNEDWKKMRQDKKTKLVERTRGRGRGRSGKGQGHFTHGRDNTSNPQGRKGRGRGNAPSQPQYKNHGPSSSEVKSGNFPVSNTSTGEKLLRPAYLTDSSTAPSKPLKGTPQTATKKEEKLHPSWQASKKRKEEQSSIQTFQGKKIKFDE